MVTAISNFAIFLDKSDLYLQHKSVMDAWKKHKMQLMVLSISTHQWLERLTCDMWISCCESYGFDLTERSPTKSSSSIEPFHKTIPMNRTIS